MIEDNISDDDAAGNAADEAGGEAGERIAKVIARAGIASRRDAEAMIAAGRVSVNGTVIDAPGTRVTTADRVAVDGKPLPQRERTRLWLLHKRRGTMTTAKDPQGRPTVFDALPDTLPRVVSVGRLDLNTEGLLLLTNDGGLARVLAHPDTAWLRRYRVRAFGDISPEVLERLSEGIEIDGFRYGGIEARIDRRQGDNVWLTMGLREGKNREVKRVLEHLGLQVNRLIRVSFGPFQLGDLPEGDVEEVRTRILKDQLGAKLAEAAEADFEAPLVERRPQGGPRVPRLASAPPKPGRDGEVPKIRSGLMQDRSGRRILVQRIEKPEPQPAARDWRQRPSGGDRPRRDRNAMPDEARPERSERPHRERGPSRVSDRAPRSGPRPSRPPEPREDRPSRPREDFRPRDDSPRGPDDRRPPRNRDEARSGPQRTPRRDDRPHGTDDRRPSRDRDEARSGPPRPPRRDDRPRGPDDRRPPRDRDEARSGPPRDAGRSDARPRPPGKPGGGRPPLRSSGSGRPNAKPSGGRPGPKGPPRGRPGGGRRPRG